MRRPIVVAIVVAFGCHREPAKPDLAADLAGLADLDTAVREHQVESWRFDVDEWSHTMAPPFDRAWNDYQRPFDRAVSHLADQLASHSPIEVRQHYADDPKLTINQARARWAMPVLAESFVATIGGTPIDAVFIRVGDSWRAIAGFDFAIRDVIDKLAPACGELIDRSFAKSCRDVAWAVADAALRSDRPRFDHACALARTSCGKPTP